MEITFFDDPAKGPRAREDVRFNGLGLFLYEDRRRLAVGFDITPFRERPSIQVFVVDASGREGGSLTVIEALEAHFNLTMHLRPEDPSAPHRVEAVLYYRTEGREPMVVDRTGRTISLATPGEL
jgi:hypothetical protein